MEQRINDIRAYGKAAKERAELLRHLAGERLTRGEAILAKCYDCENFYQDGKKRCRVKGCPLWAFNPYSQRDV